MCKKCVNVNVNLEVKDELASGVMNSVKMVSKKITELNQYDVRVNIDNASYAFMSVKSNLIRFLDGKLKVELPIKNDIKKTVDIEGFFKSMDDTILRLVTEKNSRIGEKIEKLNRELKQSPDGSDEEKTILEKLKKLNLVESSKMYSILRKNIDLCNCTLYTTKEDTITYCKYVDGVETYKTLEVKKGTKFTRIVNEIYGIEYADLFAMAYQTVEGNIKENYTLMLSVDPIDFLLMSDRNSNAGEWSSCHEYTRDGNGEASYRQGIVSAMFDHNTMIAYLLNSEGKKVFRQLYFIDLLNSTVVAGRHYPKVMDIVEENIIQYFKGKMDIKKIDVGNKETMLKNNGEGYKDKPSNIYSKIEVDPERVQFGSKYCMACNMFGNEFSEKELFCNECHEGEEKVTCYRCDIRIDPKYSYYSDITYETYCEECFYQEFSSCECCGEFYLNEDLKEVKKYSSFQRGYVTDSYMCEYCLDNGKTRQSYCKCSECGYYYSIDDTYYFENDCVCHDCGDPDEIYLCDTDGFYKYKKDEEFLDCDCDTCNELKPEQENEDDED